MIQNKYKLNTNKYKMNTPLKVNTKRIKLNRGWGVNPFRHHVEIALNTIRIPIYIAYLALITKSAVAGTCFLAKPRHLVNFAETYIN